MILQLFDERHYELDSHHYLTATSVFEKNITYSTEWNNL